MSDLVARAARSLETDERCIAPALAGYRRRHALDDGALAAFLGCPVAAVQALALCSRPNPAAPGYSGAVSAIARYVGCDAERLAMVLAEG